MFTIWLTNQMQFRPIKIICSLYVFMYRYNTLRTKTHPTELQLIIKEVDIIESLINDAQHFVTWNSKGIRLKCLRFYCSFIYTYLKLRIRPKELHNKS